MLRKLFLSSAADVEIPRNRVSPEGVETISGGGEFRLAVVRHCARADRSGRVFSLILFDLSGMPVEQQDNIAEAAARRARATDHVGWYVPTEQLGVILCGCRTGPARTFANNVLEDNAIERDALPYQVYMRPGDTLPEEIARLLPEKAHHAGNDRGESTD